MTDPRKELSLVQKHVRQHNRDVGEQVLWYEFIPLASTASDGSFWDDVYDEGSPGVGGRIYGQGILIPTIYVAEVEDQMTAQDDARQPVYKLNLTFLYDDALGAGMSDPRDYTRHLDDLVFYEDHWYKVFDFHVRGRLAEDEVIGVQCYEVKIDQEFPNDPGPIPPPQVDLPWPSTLP